jgi:hypothetical protein
MAVGGLVLVFSTRKPKLSALLSAAHPRARGFTDGPAIMVLSIHFRTPDRPFLFFSFFTPPLVGHKTGNSFFVRCGQLWRFQ